jgi:hypothetical protein
MVGYDKALFCSQRTIAPSYGVLGIYIAARLAPNRPMLHATILGLPGVCLKPSLPCLPLGSAVNSASHNAAQFPRDEGPPASGFPPSLRSRKSELH